jgi:hypothetical protein
MKCKILILVISILILSNGSFSQEIKSVKHNKFVMLGDNFSTHNDQYINDHVSNLNMMPQVQYKKRSKLPYIFWGSGIIAAGGAAIFKYLSDNKYEDYKDATTPSDALKLYKDVEDLNLKTELSLGVSAVMVVWGLMAYLDQSSQHETKSNYSFFIGPGKTKKSLSVGLEINLDKAILR